MQVCFAGSKSRTYFLVDVFWPVNRYTVSYLPSSLSEIVSSYKRSDGFAEMVVDRDCEVWGGLWLSAERLDHVEVWKGTLACI